MKELHIIPNNSLFAQQIMRKYPDATYLFYERNGKKLKKFRDLLWVHVSVLLGKKQIVFHSVPASWIFLIVIFCGARITLQYWGGDIYDMLGGKQVIKYHCLRRQNIIENVDDRDKSTKKKIQQMLNLFVFGQVRFVKLPEKEYRLCKHFYRLIFGKWPKSKRFHDGRYRAFEENVFTTKEKIIRKGQVKIIVCHSATSDAHVEHTAEWLSTIPKKNNIEVFGFVSYGAGSNKSPADVVNAYSSTFKNLGIKNQFISNFLTPDELLQELHDKDYLFISSYRNEGNGMIDLFLETGGKCAFNRFSMNYHLYKKRYDRQILTHEECITELSEL